MIGVFRCAVVGSRRQSSVLGEVSNLEQDYEKSSEGVKLKSEALVHSDDAVPKRCQEARSEV